MMPDNFRLTKTGTRQPLIKSGKAIKKHSSEIIRGPDPKGIALLRGSGTFCETDKVL
jgi:hypothetical protein